MQVHLPDDGFLVAFDLGLQVFQLDAVSLNTAVVA